MKFTCDVLSLKSALNILEKAVDTRPFNPILTCIKVECRDGKLLATTNNLTTAITTAIPTIKSEEDGVACLPCAFLKNVVGKIEKGHDIGIAVDENLDATISWTKGKFELKALDPDEFPEFPEVGGSVFKLPPEALAHIKYAYKFASKDPTKQVLTGVQVQVVGKKLTALATDGHRLGVSSGDVDIEDFNLLIPMDGVKILGLISDGAIEVKSNASQISFESNGSQLSTRTLEGQYPNCLAMIPPEFEHQITINGRDLKSAIERVLLADNGNRNVIFRFGGILARIESFPNSENRASEDVVSSATCTDIAVGIHGPYIQSALPDGDITFCINSPDKPVVVREEEGDRLALIMPIQFR